MTRLAIIADIHLHDIRGGYGSARDGRLAFRTLADTAASTRVFNESEPALLAILEDIATRGIREVVLLGDQTDDGQPGAYSALKAILNDHSDRFGLRFHATLGNHDAFGPEGRHMSKWLTDGQDPARLVTSDPDAAPSAIVRDGMRGVSTAEAIDEMKRWGLMRPDHALHWETPFGTSDAVHDRAGEDGQIDASYLIEPVRGLWLLMLDANVFSRREPGWFLHADAAWDHVLARRPHMAPWIADVARRAELAEATLLAFSHYPMIAYEAAHTPSAGWHGRMPSRSASTRLSQTGLRWHFNGHMHAGGHASQGGLTNVGIPSPVRFPGGYVVVEIAGDRVDWTHIAPPVRHHDIAFDSYAAQRPDRAHPPEWASFTGFLQSFVKGR